MTSENTPTMHVVRYHAFGGPEVLRPERVARPTPGAGEVSIQIAATSFNPVDAHVRQGVLAKMIPTPLPIVPGLDVAGTIVALGEGVTGLRVGAPVVAMLPLNQHGGAAETVIVKADLVAAAPTRMDLVDAAALPLAGLAARQAAIEHADVRAGQRVLVVGAAGAVGSLVVQLAIAAGAQVTAVDDPKHAERLRSYGAHAILDRLDLDGGPSQAGGHFDVVFNHVRSAPADLAKLTASVADDGIAVSTAGPVPLDDTRRTRSASVWVAPSGAHLADLVARIDAGQLKLHVAARRALRDLRQVHEEADAGRLVGKTVLVIA